MNRCWAFYMNLNEVIIGFAFPVDIVAPNGCQYYCPRYYNRILYVTLYRHVFIYFWIFPPTPPLVVANLLLLFALNFMLTFMDFSNKTSRAQNWDFVSLFGGCLVCVCFGGELSEIASFCLVLCILMASLGQSSCCCNGFSWFFRRPGPMSPIIRLSSMERVEWFFCLPFKVGTSCRWSQVNSPVS